MTNDALNNLMNEREHSKERLKKVLGDVGDISPMSVISGRVNLDGLMTEIHAAINLNDQVITELVSRELNRDQAELIDMIGG